MRSGGRRRLGRWSAAWSSQSATTRCTCGIVRRRRSGRGGKTPARRAASAHLLPLAPLEPDEEAVAEHHGHRVAVERVVAPPLELVPAQLPLRLLVVLLDPV